MKDRNNTLTIYGSQWEVVADFLPQPIEVTTLAALMPAFLDLGNGYKALLFVCAVPGAHAAAFVIDTTEDPAELLVEDRDSPGAIPEVACGAGRQATVQIDNVSRLGWRLSAYSSENGAPATSVNFRILGLRR